MEALVAYIAEQVVDHPDDVSVTKKASDGGDTYEISVHEDDLGHVIGRHGRTAKAMRAVVGAAAAKHGGHAQVEIVE